VVLGELLLEDEQVIHIVKDPVKEGA